MQVLWASLHRRDPFTCSLFNWLSSSFNSTCPFIRLLQSEDSVTDETVGQYSDY